MLSDFVLKNKAASYGLLALSALFGLGVVQAQSTQATQTTRSAQAVALAPRVTLRTMAQSVLTEDYTVVRLRRFFLNAGVVTVRERARVDANGTKSPDYEFDFLGVEGEPQGSPLWQEWAQASPTGPAPAT